MIAKMAAAIAVALGLVVASAAGAQQLKLAATSQEEQLHEKCLRWFDNKKYVGVIKNSDHPRYRSGRRQMTLSATTAGVVSTTNGTLACSVSIRSEDDGHQVDVRDYLFGGSTAKWTSLYTPTRVQLTLTPRGACLWYQGALALYGTLYNAGEGLFCP